MTKLINGIILLSLVGCAEKNDIELLNEKLNKIEHKVDSINRERVAEKVTENCHSFSLWMHNYNVSVRGYRSYMGVDYCKVLLFRKSDNKNVFEHGFALSDYKVFKKAMMGFESEEPEEEK